MKLLHVSALLAGLLPTLVAAKGSNPLSTNQIKSFVTFGDSYTDVVNKGDGPDAQAWPVYLAGYTNTTLFPFAKSGATCSNNLTFRPFPPLFESQLPAYFDFLANQTSANGRGKGGRNQIGGDDTIYTLWIGTNDLGVSSLLTGDAEIRVPGVSLVDVVQCMVNWVKVLYDQGNAKIFLFQNMIPLEHVILYAPDSYPNRFWPGDLPRNTTQWSLQMTEMVKAGNALTKSLLRDLIEDRQVDGAKIAYFDSHALFTDILDHPAQYLNGTAPLNTTGCINSCVFETSGAEGDCTVVPEGPERDSFLWFDELHPSEQADRVVAREISRVFKGEESRWTTWLS